MQAALDAALSGKPPQTRQFLLELPEVKNWPETQMVVIPPGKFLMGAGTGDEDASENEFPQHEVRIDYAFALGLHTVTFAEWDAALVAGAKLEKPDDKGWARADRPVINVSWQDAQDYLAWLNGRLGLADRPDAYRLPSEAEWEYACKAGTSTRYNFGNAEYQLRAYAWFSGNARGRTQPVGRKQANPFGLFDMHGNVWEWCEDAWHASYREPGRPDDGKPWLGSNSSSRVLRGGSWLDYPQNLRCANQSYWTATYRFGLMGFRLARTVSPPVR
jgi:formylglycine-generating enzyme required for sulfatase activity